MASPQTENGYTPIANELLERVYSAPFYGSQLKIILLIFRYSYGFSRKSHSLSISFIHNALGGNKRTIQRELQSLIDKNVVLVVEKASFNSSRELAVNKDYETWEVSFSQQAACNTTDGLQTATTDGLQTAQDKQGLKQNIKQSLGDFQSPPVSNTSKISNAELDSFFETVWKLYPRKQGKGKISKNQKVKLFKIGSEEISRCVERYNKHIKVNSIESQYIQYGSTFFNSGYVDYLDANYLQKAGGKALPPIGNNITDWSGF